MKKDVLVQVKGIRTNRYEPNEEEEAVESITAGTYYKRNGSHYILYEECLGDPEDMVKNRVKIRPDTVEMTRTGSAAANMQFQLGKKNISLYQTMYGEMEMAILTELIQIEESDHQFCLQLRYELEINNRYCSDNQIEITLTPNNNEIPKKN